MAFNFTRTEKQVQKFVRKMYLRREIFFEGSLLKPLFISDPLYHSITLKKAPQGLGINIGKMIG